MADYGAAHHMHIYGRRRHGVALDGTVHFAPAEPKESSPADKAQAYDRALLQSRYLASSRRRGPSGSVMGASAFVTGAGPSASSVFGGYSTAQTAVLGDSQGSVVTAIPGRASGAQSPSIPAEELDPSDVGSGLGESYVDGAKRSRVYGEGEDDNEDLQDGGVLGLLAQIYGRKEGAAAAVL